MGITLFYCRGVKPEPTLYNERMVHSGDEWGHGCTIVHNGGTIVPMESHAVGILLWVYPKG